MRSSSRLGSSPARCLGSIATLVALASVLFTAAPALADEPAPSAAPPATGAAPAATPSADAAPATPPAAAPPTAPAAAPAEPATPALPSPAPPPAPATAGARAVTPDADDGIESRSRQPDTRRAEGLRLGLALAYQRAFSGTDTRLSSGSPSLIPLELAVSFRTGPSMLLGFNGYYGIASRDDCISADSCRARGYGLGGHIENVLGKGKSFVPFIRYGVGYEVLYHGGAPLDAAGHTYRGALDFFDFRIGGDFIASRGEAGKTTRIGAYAGFVGGFLVNQSGVSYSQGSSRNLDTAIPTAHLWFTVGLRATLDP